jgi:hypothetical protein
MDFVASVCVCLCGFFCAQTDYIDISKHPWDRPKIIYPLAGTTATTNKNPSTQ